MEKYFAQNGVLSKFLPSFEARSGQMEMAESVARVLGGRAQIDSNGGPIARMLVAEAETGIGKTLAYLIPSVLSGKKIVVSTATINLQDQILKKDIPLLEKIFETDLKVLCVKGRQNYLCHYRWHQFSSNSQQSLLADNQAEKVEKWLEKTDTGDRAELKWLPDKSSFWQKIASNSNQCLGSDCPEHSYCFVNQLRKKASKANLLIVNHHLLFSDLALRKSGHGEVLPRYEAVVFDEAHHVENVATTFFGRSISQYQLLDLIGDIERQAKVDLTLDSFDEFVSELRGVKQRIDSFALLFPASSGRYPLDDLLKEVGDKWVEEVEILSLAITRLAGKIEKYNEYSDVWNSLSSRAYDLDKTLHEVALADTALENIDGYVHWYERRERSVVLSATPIHVADEIERTLYRTVDACIMTSATLSTGDNFKYFRQRLGLPEDIEYLQLPSPFDYPARTMLYVPESNYPEPSERVYQEKTNKRIAELIEISKGRALVLFTSFRGMDAVADYLEENLDYPVYVQGTLPRRTLLEMFAQETDSVLLAVASFWEGVDVPGESLSCVIIDKLPFEVPSDPVFKARVDEVTRNGGKPFFDFQVPRAILSLKQGVGRLMRSSTDSGLIAILDVRLFSKGYGKKFRKSLPPSPIVRSLDPVKEMFKSS